MPSFNGHTRVVYGRPKLTSWEAFDALPAELRHELNVAATTWDPNDVLRVYRKQGLDEARAAIRDVNRRITDPAYLGAGLKPEYPI